MGGVPEAFARGRAARVPIAVVMTSFDPGGTERQMIELVRRLDRDRWAVHVACLHARGAWLSRVVEAVESVAEFPITSFAAPGTLHQMWRFARWCRQHRIAVVHTTELYSNIFALVPAACAGVPVRIASRREINPDKTAAQIALQRAAYVFAHKVVANSRAAAERLAFERVPARKIAVVPNGLEARQFDVRRTSGPRRRVTVVANLRPEKGHDVLLDAALHVLRRFPDARFELVGGGTELETLLARVEARRMQHAVAFLGHRDDVPARLAEADIFALPSRSEAFPNAVLEAMAAGLPIVASGVGGILELVDDGRTGLLVRPGDAEALAAKLCGLMEDEALSARLGAAARKEAHARYSFERMVSGFEHIYLTELTRRGVVVSRQPQLAAS